MTSSVRFIAGVLLVANVMLWRIGTLESQGPNYKLQVIAPKDGLRVQIDTAGGQVASFGGLGEFDIDAPFTVGGRLAVKEDGKIGIGAPNPDQLLTINAINAATNSLVSFKQGGTTSGYAGLGQDARLRVEALPGTELRLQADGNAKPMTFYHNNAERMRIDGTGMSVAGTVQSTSGGFKFPDGSVQSAAVPPTAPYTTIANNGVYGLASDGTFANVAHLNLPAGTYLILASVRFSNNAETPFQNNDRTVSCKSPQDPGYGQPPFVPFEYSQDLASFTAATMTMHWVLDISSGGVDVACNTFGDDVLVNDRRLTAMSVGNMQPQ